MSEVRQRVWRRLKEEDERVTKMLDERMRERYAKWEEAFEASAAAYRAERDRVRSVINSIEFPGYEFVLENTDGGWFVHVRYDEPDVMTGVVEEQNGRRWFFPDGQTAGQIVQTCFKAILTSLEHRAREHFTYKGKPVLQPHLDVDQIWAMMPDRETVAEPIQFDADSQEGE